MRPVPLFDADIFLHRDRIEARAASPRPVKIRIVRSRGRRALERMARHGFAGNLEPCSLLGVVGG